jgi:flagellar protein FliJ
MKSRQTLIRLRRFEVDEKRRKVADIEYMINDFKQMAADLDRQIAMEQERAGVSDINHYAYPTFAKAALQRRDNLLESAVNLEAKLAAAQAELAEVYDELKKIELLEERNPDRSKADRARAEQDVLDEVAANVNRAAG